MQYTPLPVLEESPVFLHFKKVTPAKERRRTGWSNKPSALLGLLGDGRSPYMDGAPLRRAQRWSIIFALSKATTRQINVVSLIQFSIEENYLQMLI